MQTTSDTLTVGQKFSCSHGYNRYTKCGGGVATVSEVNTVNVLASCKCGWSFCTQRSASIRVPLVTE
jgi:hypothetical protein